jgi:hypothetical protein
MAAIIVLLIIVIICVIMARKTKKHREQMLAEKLLAEKRRKEWLLAKYGDAEVVDKIIRKTVWQGETSEQLRDSWGEPIDIDHHLMKTKTKEVWKYNQTGKGRFALRITIEDGKIIGWDEKS